MPKIPIQTSPTVAPQPVNLPGPRRTYAGSGLTALGEGVFKMAQAVGAKQEKADVLASKEIAQRQFNELNRDMNRYRLDPKDGYEHWSTLDSTGTPTRAGVTEAYVGRVREAAAKHGAGLDPRAREIFDAMVEAKLTQWEAELLRYESGALKKERIGTYMAAFQRVTDEKAAKASKLDLEDLVDPATKVATLTDLMSGSDEAKKHWSDVADEQGLLPLSEEDLRAGKMGPRERLIQEGIAQYHAQVLDFLVKNPKIPKAVAKEYLDLVMKQDEFVANNATFKKVVGEVDEITTTERIEQQAADAVKLASDKKGGSDLAREMWDEKYGKDFAGLKPRVHAQIRKIYAVAEADAYADDTSGGKLARLIAIADQENIEQIEDPRLSFKLPDKRVFSAKDLRSGQARKELAAALREPKVERELARDRAPDGIESPQAKAIWKVLKTLPESQQAEVKDLTHPILEELSSNEAQAIVREAQRRAASNAANGMRGARNKLAEFMESVTPVAFKNANVKKSAEAYAEERLLEAGRDGNITEDEVNTILLDALVAVDIPASTAEMPRFLDRKNPPIPEGDKERYQFYPEGYQQKVQSQAAFIVQSLGAVYGPPTRVVLRNGAVKILAPGEAPPPGARVIPFGGRAIDRGEFDALNDLE